MTNGPTFPSFRCRPDPEPPAIYQDGEDKAYETFKASAGGDCRRAGVPALRFPRSLRHSDPSQVQVRGQGLPSQFSVTRGTIFARRKMGFVDLLGAICIFVNAREGPRRVPA